MYRTNPLQSYFLIKFCKILLFQTEISTLFHNERLRDINFTGVIDFLTRVGRTDGAILGSARDGPRKFSL